MHIYMRDNAEYDFIPLDDGGTQLSLDTPRVESKMQIETSTKKLL